MSLSRLTSHIAIAAAAMVFAASAFAHPELVSSTPTDKSEGAAPTTIELKFTETLNKKFSGATLTMTEMPGMANHGAMKISAGVAGGSDDKTMVITPAQALVAGTYRVDWRAVSADTHPIKGSISFQVK